MPSSSSSSSAQRKGGGYQSKKQASTATTHGKKKTSNFGLPFDHLPSSDSFAKFKKGGHLSHTEKVSITHNKFGDIKKVRRGGNVDFDPLARKEFVTGFHKRKKQRSAYGSKVKQEEAAQERRNKRKELRALRNPEGVDASADLKTLAAFDDDVRAALQDQTKRKKTIAAAKKLQEKRNKRKQPERSSASDEDEEDDENEEEHSDRIERETFHRDANTRVVVTTGSIDLDERSDDEKEGKISIDAEIQERFERRQREEYLQKQKRAQAERAIRKNASARRGKRKPTYGNSKKEKRATGKSSRGPNKKQKKR